MGCLSWFPGPERLSEPSRLIQHLALNLHWLGAKGDRSPWMRHLLASVCLGAGPRDSMTRCRELIDERGTEGAVEGVGVRDVARPNEPRVKVPADVPEGVFMRESPDNHGCS